MLVMDHSNLSDVNRSKPAGSKTIVKLFGEFDPMGDTIISDPYYGGIDGFEKNFRQVERCSEAFLAFLGFGKQ
ncbi:hypothetical protein HK098_002857 [Nowakowskiella sp. JEL0407]|nr:hypothetical protein HK098_002857 [Nowakowskiella sp. JEL0407]